MRTLGSALLVFVFAACSTTNAPRTAPVPAPGTPTGEPQTAEAPEVGVLVMAHGGTPEWNASVTEAVAEFRTRVPTAVAYGMAHPRTLRAGLDSLAESGVDRVAVVRMFLTGTSFLDQTEWYLGMSETPPAQFVLMNHGAHGHHHEPTRDPLPHDFRIATHMDGLLDAEEAGRILLSRVEAHSTDPSSEAVLLLAHGAGSDAVDAGIVRRVEAFARPLHDAGFASVMPTTLREDWDEARKVAEAEILEWMEGRRSAGERVIVVPVRLSGFGPYAEVLEGYDYAAAEGLLPHPIITEWVENTADRVACGAGWGPLTAESCPASVVVDPEVSARR